MKKKYELPIETLLFILGVMFILVFYTNCAHFTSKDDDDNGFTVKVYKAKNQIDRTPAEYVGHK